MDVATSSPRTTGRTVAPAGDLIADLLVVCDQLADAESVPPHIEEALAELYGNADYRPLPSPNRGAGQRTSAALIEAAENRALDLLEE